MSKYINLIDKLTKEDKETITAYIEKYGVKDGFIGVDAWLQNWSHANQKLYKLLGNSFIKKIPYKWERKNTELIGEIRTALDNNSFYKNYRQFLDYLEKNCTPEINKIDRDMSWDTFYVLESLVTSRVLAENSVPDSCKYLKTGNRKTLQINKGEKPLRAINKVIEYFKNDYDFDIPAFEELKKEYGIIMSNKQVSGYYCVSIHPMDFMTMSDNASNWSSCMSWKEGGCYHVGTVEMMNSNNVLCGYLIGNTPFVFDDKKIDPETGEIIGSWNNKKWRSLFYVTKDIIMSGKQYPYVNDTLAQEILRYIKQLAKENWHIDYTYGLELYQDMIHVNGYTAMENQRSWVRMKSKYKKNIIFDTKGMYNDMLNDSDTDYWCYRNKVDRTKLISVSGKSVCLCCGNESINEDYDGETYNDRYSNTGEVICQECLSNYSCNYCDSQDPTKKIYKLDNGKIVCERCAKKFLYICPCCGKTFCIDFHANKIPKCYYNPVLFEKLNKGELLNKKFKIHTFTDYYDPIVEDYDEKYSEIIDLGKDYNDDSFKNIYKAYAQELFCCKDCIAKMQKFFTDNSIKIHKTMGFWSRIDTEKAYLVNPKSLPEPYFQSNLVKSTIEQFQFDINHSKQTAI